jgi:hypothetical protein
VVVTVVIVVIVAVTVTYVAARTMEIRTWRAEGLAHPRTSADHQDIDTGSGTSRYWTCSAAFLKPSVGYAPPPPATGRETRFSESLALWILLIAQNSKYTEISIHNFHQWSRKRIMGT